MSGLHDRLNAAIGAPISLVCDGPFHSPSSNHCAHFVSHMAGLEFAFNCKQFKGGDGTPANIRVHEIFSQCPLLGHWKDADKTKTLLIFVTKESNVDIARKKMRNIPQKHIGIYSQGNVYHYSNSHNQVVICTPDEFLEEFASIYPGKQGLFFGTFSGSDLELTVHPTATAAPRGTGFDLQKDRRHWFAAPGGHASARFYVGTETNNGAYIGLFMPAGRYYGPTYRAEDYEGAHGHWGQILELIGYCESKNHFNLINTYDSAKFTFGFCQLAAHTARDNLILLFRRLLELPEAADYFPELTLKAGRLHRRQEDGGITDLEVETPSGPGGRRQLQRFMDFLNAKRMDHDMQEVLQSARMVHWANTHSTQRDLQVEVASDIVQFKMSRLYARWYDLDGQSDLVCALIADIHHQGRASRARVRNALTAPDPIEALITVNPNYSGRIRDLRQKSAAMTASGQLGGKRYDAGLNEFA